MMLSMLLGVLLLAVAVVSSAFQAVARTKTWASSIRLKARYTRSTVSIHEAPLLGRQAVYNISLEADNKDRFTRNNDSDQATLEVTNAYSYGRVSGPMEGLNATWMETGVVNATFGTVDNNLAVALKVLSKVETVEANKADKSVSDTAYRGLTASENVVATKVSLYSDETCDLNSVRSNTTKATGFAVAEMLPESCAVEDSAISDKIEAPSVSKIIRFAIPATGVWLCSPLLSLIDTSTVGLLSGTVQQAALNPAVAVTEYTALLIAFLYTGSTNLIASAREQDLGIDGSPTTTAKVVGAVQLSTYVGIGMGIFLFTFAGHLVRIILGKGDLSPVVLEAAVRYVKIRALGMPAAAMIGTAQAACLGMQDARSPLYVLLAAAVVNFAGDILLVRNSNPWIGGAAGAAWATSFSQCFAAALFVNWLCKKPKPVRMTNVVNISNSVLAMKMMDQQDFTSDSKIEPRTIVAFAQSLFRYKRNGIEATRKSFPSAGVSVSYKEKEKAFSSRGFLEGRARKRDFLKLPPKSIVKEFSPYVLPVTATSLGRVSSYVAMSHVISSSLGTLAMAAQQVMLSFFYSFAPIADSLSLTAQSFVPSISEKRRSKARAVALRQTMNNLARVAIVFAALMVALTAGIPMFSQFSTSDANVISTVTSVSPYMIGVATIHSTIIAFEGILLGRKDLGFVGKMYSLWFFGVPYFMLKVKRAVLAGQPLGLGSVWKVFLCYNVIRALTWVGRVLVIQKRTEREVDHLNLEFPQ